MENENNRLKLLLESIVLVSEGNYNVELPISNKNDLIDGISISLNMMIEEIQKNILNEASSKRKYQNLINTIREGVMELNLEDKIMFTNASFCTLTGYTPRTLIGKPIYDLLIDDEDKIRMKNWIQGQKECTSSSLTIEVPIRKNDDQKIWLSFTSNPMVSSQGVVKGLLTTCHDITISRRETLQREISYNIAEKSAELDLSIEELGEIIYQELGRIMDVSSFYIGIINEDQDELQIPFFVENSRKVTTAECLSNNSTINNYIVSTGKSLHLKKDKMLKWLKNHQGNDELNISSALIGTPLKLQRKIIGLLMVRSSIEKDSYDAHDLKLLEFVSKQVAVMIEKKRVENNLKAIEQIQRSLLNSTSAITLIIHNKRFVYVNPAMEKLTGYSIEELEQIDPWSIIDVSYRDQMKQRAESRLKGEKTISRYESILLTKKGDSLFLDISACVIDFMGSKAILATCFDITKRKQAENKLKSSELKYKSLINNIGEGVLHVDNDEIIEFVSSRFCKITGYSSSELIGHKASDILLNKGASEHELMKEVLKQRKMGISSTMELPILCKNGEIKWVLNSGTPIYNSRREVIGSVGILADISEIRETRASLALEKKTALSYQSRLLSAQLSPHFIFNSLNSIQYYVLKNNPGTTVAFVSEFSQLMRDVLTNSVNDKISLEREISFLKSYLDIESKRMPEKLAYSIHVATNIDPEDFYIPPMLLQPYLENAIIHGVSNCQNNGHISIQFSTKDNYMICEIIDNGPGRDATTVSSDNANGKKHKSMSTSIIDTRLSVLNGLNGQRYKVDIKDRIEKKIIKGTCVYLWIPQD